jgi:uroporphyrinogen-III synthase
VSAPENGRGLEGLRVLTLESRRAEQMAKLIESQGGIPISAPSMREVPLKENPAAFAFAEKLFAGELDLVIFLTGVGARILFSVVETKHPRAKLVEALSRVPVLARGPKPAAVLREFAVPVTLVAAEPNTWQDILKALDSCPPLADLKDKRVAIQEYGIPNRELIEKLEARGARVTSVPVYQWALPEDTAPLRRAVTEIANGNIDVLVVTSATQVQHLMQIASESGADHAVRQGLRRAVIASIGPISSESLREIGVAADLEPVHPKMGQLIHDTAERAKALLRHKRE